MELNEYERIIIHAYQALWLTATYISPCTSYVQ